MPSLIEVANAPTGQIIAAQSGVTVDADNHWIWGGELIGSDPYHGYIIETSVFGGFTSRLYAVEVRPWFYLYYKEIEPNGTLSPICGETGCVNPDHMTII